ncbi:unnamed protein product [Effrenium voratum]|nr:unnamed protein product [Effrenium voratum]
MQAATGLENLAHTLRPLGILGAAAWLCHRAPRWAVLIWAHAGRKRAMARGADGFAWVFWLGFPGFADSWSSSLWHAWQGESRRGFWKALNGIQEELQRKGKARFVDLLPTMNRRPFLLSGRRSPLAIFSLMS